MLRNLDKTLKILFFRETVCFCRSAGSCLLFTMAKRRIERFQEKLKNCEKDGKVLQISTLTVFPTPTEIFEAKIVFVLILNHL